MASKFIVNCINLGKTLKSTQAGESIYLEVANGYTHNDVQKSVTAYVAKFKGIKVVQEALITINQSNPDKCNKVTKVTVIQNDLFDK